MPISANDGGTWKEATNMYVKDGGTWKEVTNGSVNDSGTWKEFHAPAPTTALPSGWSEAAISTAVLHPTGSTYDAGTFTWRGAGDDIWSNDDRCVFIYHNFEDGETLDAHVQTAIVEGGTQGDLEQYSGIYLMAREGLQKDDKQFCIGVNPNNNRVQQKRRWDNNATQESNTNPGSPYIPMYFRITRSAGVITTYYSQDGVTYTQLGEMPNIGTATWYGGMAVSSHDDATPDYIISTGTMSIT